MTSAQATDPRALPDEPLALDLVNTEFLPDGTLVDLLATVESTRAWLTAAGLDQAASGNPGPTRAALRQARTAITDALSGRGTAPLNEVLGHGCVRLSVSAGLVPLRTLDADDPAWQPAVMAAANLLDLLEQAPDRIKHCENPACVLWFFDTTRNGTRRWCSMAVCGNRMKARRHYDRVKTRLYRDAAVAGRAAPGWGHRRVEGPGRVGPGSKLAHRETVTLSELSGETFVVNPRVDCHSRPGPDHAQPASSP